VRIRVPEPCRLHDEIYAAGTGLPVRLASNVVSFAWVRRCPPRPIRHGLPTSRTVVNRGERQPTLLESVLGATPQEFESPILRHRRPATTRLDHVRAVRFIASVLSHFLSQFEFWPYALFRTNRCGGTL